MEFLYLLEGIRTPFLDQVFALITHLGSEIVFMVLAVVMFWCVNKSQGLYLLSVGCLGTTVNQFLKLACRVPRPWVRDPDFTIVESARADATGYSFPSGHTQNAVGTFGCLAMGAKRNWLKIVFVVLAVLTSFSRMYLGVHTPSDVLVSAGIALLMVAAMHPLFKGLEDHPERGFWILLGLFAVNVLFVIYANTWNFPADVDPENLEHGVKNAAKLMGALLGMAVGYGIDMKWIRFQTEASLVGQILKCVLGLAIVLAIKEGLKPLLGSGSLSSAVRYGLITLFAAGIWPLTFPFFSKLGRKKA